MIRFKVIRAKSIVRFLVLLALVGILTMLIMRLLRENGANATMTMGTSIVQNEHSNEVVAAFAAAASFNSPLFGIIDEEVRSGITIERLPVESMPAATVSPSPKPKPKKRVLIYHTHTHEAYQQNPDDPYQETTKWRTADANHSIVRVGDELTKLLTSAGIEVVHDRTDHEPPKLGTAYTRSLLTLQTYKDQQFDLVIDMHRDAYNEAMGENNITVGGGRHAAKLMILLGNGEGFKEKPFFVENMAFAQQLTKAINAECAKLCKDVLVKNGRYNQHVMSPSILIEVGNNMNTLDEAIAALPMLANAIDKMLQGDIFLS